MIEPLVYVGISILFLWFLKPFVQRLGELLAERLFPSKNNGESDGPTVVLDLPDFYNEDVEPDTTRLSYDFDGEGDLNNTVSDETNTANDQTEQEESSEE
jgi:hypothetical protein